jgi:ribosomal protein S18 acetylase RimI-like enzyme
MSDLSLVAVVREENPCTLDARAMLDELSAMLALYSADGAQSRFSIEDVQRSRSAFAVARTIDGHAIGCGDLRRYSFEIEEFKRIYRRPQCPGTGAAILQFLEDVAVSMGYRRVILETRAANRRAVAFYQRHGYETIEPFGEYIGAAGVRCLGKTLAPAQCS